MALGCSSPVCIAGPLPSWPSLPKLRAAVLPQSGGPGFCGQVGRAWRRLCWYSQWGLCVACTLYLAEGLQGRPGCSVERAGRAAATRAKQLSAWQPVIYPLPWVAPQGCMASPKTGGACDPSQPNSPRQCCLVLGRGAGPGSHAVCGAQVADDRDELRPLFPSSGVLL